VGGGVGGGEGVLGVWGGLGGGGGEEGGGWGGGEGGGVGCGQGVIYKGILGDFVRGKESCAAFGNWLGGVDWGNQVF